MVNLRRGTLGFSTATQFAVISPYCRRFTVCRCCSQFFGDFITHTLHAALQHYTDIAVSVFKDFGHGFWRILLRFCSFYYPPMSPSLSGEIKKCNFE